MADTTGKDQEHWEWLCEENEEPRVRVKARTVFTESEIAEAKRRGKKKAAIEMEVYNLRTLRGDFD